MKISFPTDASLSVKVTVRTKRGRGCEWKGEESDIEGRQFRYKKPPRPMEASQEQDLTLHSSRENLQSGERGK